MRPVWYIKQIKKKKNKTWSLEQKLEIYTLRRRNVKVEYLSKLYNVSPTVIYNITRIVKKAMKEKCYICGKHLKKDEIKDYRFIQTCKKCKKKWSEYKKERRKKKLKEQLCTYCEKRPVVPGHTGCMYCLSATHRRRYKENLCGRCGKRPIAKGSISLCKTCLMIQRKKNELSNSLSS